MRAELYDVKLRNGAPVFFKVRSDCILDLGPRALKPGDALHVKLVAIDNSPWAQRGESRELLLKIPTMEERRQIAADRRLVLHDTPERVGP